MDWGAFGWTVDAAFATWFHTVLFQDLLGCERGKTIEIYTHIAQKGWDKLRSAIDDLPI